MILNRRVLVLGLLLALLTAACQSVPEQTSGAFLDTGTQNAGWEQSRSEPTSDDNPFADPVTGGGVDFRLIRNDVSCERQSLNVVYPEMFFVVAHVVVDGNLGAPCFGEPDLRLTDAWNILAKIVPAGQLHDLTIFGGFISNEPDQTTLAYVNAANGSDTGFRISVNLTEAELDIDELMLTMAHEFAHVLTAQPDQIDRTIAFRDCQTWHNLRGCYERDSLMWQWIEIFWDDGRIDLLKPKQERSSAAGEELCIFDPSFLGPYAASHPEEDFAQAFSAFVFRVEMPSRELEQKMEWFARQPELAEFRNQAIEADLGPLQRYFNRCG